jgi:3-methyladenine DNA glycosylase AlkD
MSALEKAGSAQTRKTYLRHGAQEPLFGVKFATLKDLLKRIGVDHDLACALWETGNFDARNLAMKIADPARMSESDLDQWARGYSARMCGGYVAALACEGPHGLSRARAWLASADDEQRAVGWSLVGALAMRDEATPDAWFLARVAEIGKGIGTAVNAERYTMNQALIAIGCRNPALRKAALAAAKRIGTVEVDHGDTACKTPDARAYVEKAWTHATSKGFESPAAQERGRKSMRLRC